jgi:hypothetical protein
MRDSQLEGHLAWFVLDVVGELDPEERNSQKLWIGLTR